MKKYLTMFAALLISSIFLLIPISTMAAKDPFFDAGFIQTTPQTPAFNFTLEDIEGRKVQLADFRGKIVLLFFWTTW